MVTYLIDTYWHLTCLREVFAKVFRWNTVLGKQEKIGVSTRNGRWEGIGLLGAFRWQTDCIRMTFFPWKIPSIKDFHPALYLMADLLPT